MTQAHRAVRVGGAWLAVASLLMVGVFLLHGPIAHDLEAQMAKIADAPLRWSVVHWMAAGALSLYAVSALIVLNARSPLTASGWTLTAWAVICVGSLWTMTTAVAEATTVAEAAASGSSETFSAWWAFAEGKANGFAVLALAVAVIAGNEARRPAGVTPGWSARIATVAGVGSFTGWAAGMWLGVAVGNLVWVVASLVMSLWTVWFGVALVRAPSGAASGEARARAADALPVAG